MKFAEEKTNGRLVLGAGTLYGAINSLVKKNWIKLFKETDKKKEYLITDLGKEAVNREIDRLAGALETAWQTIC